MEREVYFWFINISMYKTFTCNFLNKNGRNKVNSRTKFFQKIYHLTEGLVKIFPDI